MEGVFDEVFGDHGCTCDKDSLHNGLNNEAIVKKTGDGGEA